MTRQLTHPGAPPASAATPEAHQRLRIVMDDRCRTLARVLALIEGRGLAIGEMRFWPASRHRLTAEAHIDVSGPPARLDTLLARIEQLPSVRLAVVHVSVALPPMPHP